MYVQMIEFLGEEAFEVIDYVHDYFKEESLENIRGLIDEKIQSFKKARYLNYQIIQDLIDYLWDKYKTEDDRKMLEYLFWFVIFGIWRARHHNVLQPRLLNEIFYKFELDSPDTVLIEGVIWLNLNIYSKALECFGRYSKLEDSTPMGFYLIGKFFEDINKKHLGMQFLIDGINKFPDNSNCKLQYAKTLYEINLLKEARPLVDRVLELEPENAQALILKAKLIYYEKAGDYDTAIEIMKKAKELDPDNWDPYLILAYIYHKQNKSDKVRSELEEFKQSYDRTGKYFTLLSDIMLALDCEDYEYCKDLCKIAETLEENRHGYSFFLKANGVSHYHLGEMKKAKILLTEYIKSNPDNKKVNDILNSIN